MFRHEGADRSHHHNQLLAGYLALIAAIAVSTGAFALLVPTAFLVAGGLFALRDPREVDLPRSTDGSV